MALADVEGAAVTVRRKVAVTLVLALDGCGARWSSLRRLTEVFAGEATADDLYELVGEDSR